MTRLERALLNDVQRDFPLDPRPFLLLAQKHGTTEKECIAALGRLASCGVLRRIGPVWNWKALGYSTVLVGLRVVPKQRDTVARKINRCAGVTHNYGRAGRFNLWFTCIYQTAHELDLLLAVLEKLRGVIEVRTFYAKKTYKIGLVLDL